MPGRSSRYALLLLASLATVGIVAGQSRDRLNDLEGMAANAIGHPEAVSDCSICHLDPVTGAPDLMGLHENDCTRCHPGFVLSQTILGPVGVWNQECSACHTPCQDATGNQQVPTKGHRCVVCHGQQMTTMPIDQLHQNHVDRANCVVCHGFIPDLGTEIGSGNRAICTVCHGPGGKEADILEIHKEHVPKGLSCLECHGGERPPVDVVNGPPVGSATVVCQICHEDKSPSKFDDDSEELHRKHTKERLDCGACHMAANLQDDRVPMPPIDDPVRAAINQTFGDACVHCHGADVGGSAQELHQQHVAEQWQWCYNCHQFTDGRPLGLEPPVTDPAQSCLMCHDEQFYDDVYPFDVHEVHAESTKCYACHQGMPPLFDWPNDWLAGDTTDCDPPCPADLDSTGAVDVGDLVAVITAWGAPGGPEDLDGSGFVDVGDIIEVVTSWGACP